MYQFQTEPATQSVTTLAVEWEVRGERVVLAEMTEHFCVRVAGSTASTALAEREEKCFGYDPHIGLMHIETEC